MLSIVAHLYFSPPLLHCLSTFHGVHRKCEQHFGRYLGGLPVFHGVSSSLARLHSVLHGGLANLDLNSLSSLVGVQTFYYFRVYTKDTFRLKAMVTLYGPGTPHYNTVLTDLKSRVIYFRSLASGESPETSPL